nr:bark storage protein a [Quercus suber]
MQRYGQEPKNELVLESNGDYTREIGYLNFANYIVNVIDGSSYDNLLNNIWYQLEEVFPINGTLEQREHAFWVSVDPLYFEISKKLEGLVLEGCINSTTCLSTTPKVTTVQRGTSASIYLDNAAYRSFIYNKFNVSPVDMESASVALICPKENLSLLLGLSSADSNEADTFTSLAANNSVLVLLAFIKHLSN